MLILSDVHDAYEKLLANRSRFYHWELRRLKTTLPASELALCQDLLKHVSRHADGLTLRQLHSRLSKHEADAERRTQRLQDLLVRLSDEGYLSPPSASQRVQFCRSAARLVEPQPCLKHFSPRSGGGFAAISKYNPHLWSAEQLRAIFVARQHELSELLDTLRTTPVDSVGQHTC